MHRGESARECEEICAEYEILERARPELDNGACHGGSDARGACDARRELRLERRRDRGRECGAHDGVDGFHYEMKDARPGIVEEPKERGEARAATARAVRRRACVERAERDVALVRLRELCERRATKE